jgi:hypothetical protein
MLRESRQLREGDLSNGGARTCSGVMILDHLLKLGFLEDDASDHVRTMLSPDAASTIAVTAVASFDSNGELRTIITRAASGLIRANRDRH